MHEPVPEQDRDAEHEACGKCEAGHVAQERLGLRLRGGGERQKNAGMPTVRAAASESWRGRNGKVPPPTPTVRMSVAANTDFATNSLATRWTLRRILRPSSTAKGIDSKLSLTSTTSATPLASWLPDPSATATSHSLSAGTSLTPSPIIPTRRPPRRSAATSWRLCSGCTRAKTALSIALRRRAPASSGSSDPVVTRPSVSMPAARATAATVAGPSPR